VAQKEAFLLKKKFGFYAKKTPKNALFLKEKMRETCVR
jgi:hypothetical protein